MRGDDELQEGLFSFSKLDDFVPTDHPLRPMKDLVNESLKRLNGLFNSIYADTGRASVAPEKLMRALLLQVFFSVRSERQLMEQIRSGTTRCSPRIVTGCSNTRSSKHSSPK